MKRVYLANDPVSANVLKLRLEENGIQAIVQDERTHELRGEVPLVYPSVWVGNEDEAAARKIALEFSHPQHGEPWTCQTCGEVLEASFADCWKCERESVEEQKPFSNAPHKKGSSLIVFAVLGLVVVICAAGLFKMVRYNSFKDHLNRGVWFHQQQQYDRAIAEYDKALVLDDKSFDAWSNRGFAYFSKNEHERAVVDLTKAIELDSLRAQVHETRAYSLFELGQTRKAMQDYEIAIGREPLRIELVAGLAAGKYEVGDLEGTLKDANKLLTDPNLRGYGMIFRAMVFYERGQHDAAMGEINHAIELDPNNSADLFLRKANLYASHRDYAEALEFCEKARKTSGPHTLYEKALRAAIYLRTQKIDDAKIQAKEVLQLATNKRDDLSCSILANIILENDQALRSSVAESLKRCPESRWTYTLAAQATIWLARNADSEAKVKSQVKALDYLEEAKSHGFIAWHLLKDDLFLNDLLDHPRFKKLAGLP